MDSDDAPILALVRDLMFSSKISATGKSLGKSVRILRNPAQLHDQSASSHLLVDLNQAGALDAAVIWKQRTGGRITGFASHVDAETIAAARKAGIDSVISRGEFTARLGEILSE